MKKMKKILLEQWNLLVLNIDLDRLVKEIFFQSLDALDAELLVWRKPHQGEVVELGVSSWSVEGAGQATKLGRGHRSSVAIVNVQDLICK